MVRGSERKCRGGKPRLKKQGRHRGKNKGKEDGGLAFGLIIDRVESLEGTLESGVDKWESTQTKLAVSPDTGISLPERSLRY